MEAALEGDLEIMRVESSVYGFAQDWNELHKPVRLEEGTATTELEQTTVVAEREREQFEMPQRAASETGYPALAR